MKHILRLLCCLAAASLAHAQDDISNRIGRVEAMAAHIQAQASSYRSTVSKSIADTRPTPDGRVNTLQAIDILDINRRTAARLFIELEDVRKEAVALLAEGRAGLPGFFSVQQDESVSKGDRIFAVFQMLECASFITTTVSQYQQQKEAFALAAQVEDGCRALVAALRNEKPVRPSKK